VQHFDDTPDDSRPRNPWPRLLALCSVLIILILGAGACLVAFLGSGAESKIRIPLNELEPDIPRFEPITSWGSDSEQFTYGIWVVRIPNQRTVAYFSREVDSGCHLQWQPTVRVKDTVGVFSNNCSENSYSIHGAAINGNTIRDLDHFDVSEVSGYAIVDFHILRIGICTRTPTANDYICSPEFGSTTRLIPRHTALPENFARQ